MKKILGISTVAIVGLALASTAKAQVGYSGDFPAAGFDTAGPELYVVITGSGTVQVITSSAMIGAGYAGTGSTFASGNYTGTGKGSLGDQGPYDGSDDTYIGVLNLSSTFTLSALHLTSTLDIFGFDGDGISTYIHNSTDSTGYGGPGVTYSGYSSPFTSGNVNFSGGVGPGGTAFFSLEEPIASALGSGSLNVSTTPDAGSSMMLLGGALAGIGALSRRLKK